MPYWSLAAAAEAGLADPLADGPALTDDLEGLLGEAVALRMEADVPLGALLSGGVDSSLVTALMQARSPRPVKTFSIGFDDPLYDEAPHAKAVAAHLGTDHTEVYLTPADAMAVLPGLPDTWDEPFADSSQIPSCLVSAVARRDVTVALTGDGGDELFAGYNRHVMGAGVWNRIEGVPHALRAPVASALRSHWTGMAAQAVSRALPNRLGVSAVAERLPKLGAIVGAHSAEEVYRRMISTWPEPADVVAGGHAPPLRLAGADRPLGDIRNDMMLLDALNYLPDDILTKVDRASMAVGLEGRVPFLDHRVIEYAWRVPLSAKIRDGRGKHILRDILYRHVPRALLDRPKKGFALPIGDWLRGPLRGWADELLDPRKLREDGFLDPAAVTAAWTALNDGRLARTTQVWTALMFQAWLERTRRRGSIDGGEIVLAAE